MNHSRNNLSPLLTVSSELLGDVVELVGVSGSDEDFGSILDQSQSLHQSDTGTTACMVSPSTPTSVPTARHTSNDGGEALAAEELGSLQVLVFSSLAAHFD